eukprot:COSAG02_NODE_2814_length_7971_cov_4.403455_8_plen_126_part_00
MRRHGLTEQRPCVLHEPTANESAGIGNALEQHESEWVSVRFSTMDYPVAFKAEWSATGDEYLDLLESTAEWKIAAPLDGKYLCQVVPHDLLVRLPDVCDGRGVVRLTWANDFLMTAVKLWHNWMK